MTTSLSTTWRDEPRRSEGAETGAREALRALRLRRAAILEQRLGRIVEACDELALVLAEWPDSAGALRYMADLLDRQGEYTRSAPLWRRVAGMEEDAEARDELRAACRAGHRTTPATLPSPSSTPTMCSRADRRTPMRWRCG